MRIPSTYRSYMHVLMHLKRLQPSAWMCMLEHKINKK